VPEELPLFDVAVIGGGNAGMCAALTAREAGARVLMLESATPELRGGNSRHTRNMRRMSQTYPEAEYFADLLKVTAGHTDEALARTAIRESFPAHKWMQDHGVRFQPALGGTLQLDRTNAFFLGGGKAVLNSYYRAAGRLGIQVLYNTEVTALRIARGAFESATALRDGEPLRVRARALVAASGGFESNLEWLEEAWGEAARNFLVRGTPHNQGKVLKALLASGAEPAGDPRQCHAIAIDARSPKFDGGIVTRLDSLPFGIVVNRNGQRFDDEGADLWPKRYAVWGRLIAMQPGQIAYSIFDSKVLGRFMPSVFPPVCGATVDELAAKLELPVEETVGTVQRFNQAVAGGSVDHSRLDGCGTQGLNPSKSNWAQRIDAAPFLAYPLRPGITFTYLGVRVGESAGMKLQDGSTCPNIFAAGEIMAGNILGQGYLAGIGMTIGAVFGRIAGKEAARAAQH
jgi:tricarballylate dehydrogenase